MVFPNTFPGKHGDLSGPTSIIRLRGFNDVGTGTHVVRYSTVIESVGIDITYTDNAVDDGATFTINVAGKYAVFGSTRSLVGEVTGITKNASGADLTGTFDEFLTNKPNDVLALTSIGGTGPVAMFSYFGPLLAGTVLRIQTQFVGSDPAPGYTYLTLVHIS